MANQVRIEYDPYQQKASYQIRDSSNRKFAKIPKSDLGNPDNLKYHDGMLDEILKYAIPELQEKRLAKELLLKKCRYFAERMGVSYGTVTVREQKTRWGSCSAKGNLNFNWKLALMPEEILDYLVVHELAHRVEMNHSPAFWAVVAEEIPDYKTRREWLRQNGAKF